MFLDVKGTIKEKSPGYEVGTVKDAIIKELSSVRVKVTMNESGDISWKGPHLAFQWERIPYILSWLEGRLDIKEPDDGGIDVTYYASLRPIQLSLLTLVLVPALFCIFGRLGIGGMLFFLGFAFLAYVITYFLVKLWLKGFIKRHIHSLD